MHIKIGIGFRCCLSTFTFLASVVAQETEKPKEVSTAVDMKTPNRFNAVDASRSAFKKKLGEYADLADTVFLGRVREKFFKSGTDPASDGKDVFTFVIYDIEHVYKGNIDGKQFIARQWGGRRENSQYAYGSAHGSHHFRVGDEEIVFGKSVEDEANQNVIVKFPIVDGSVYLDGGGYGNVRRLFLPPSPRNTEPSEDQVRAEQLNADGFWEFARKVAPPDPIKKDRIVKIADPSHIPTRRNMVEDDPTPTENLQLPTDDELKQLYKNMTGKQEPNILPTPDVRPEEVERRKNPPKQGIIPPSKEELQKMHEILSVH